MKRYNIRSATQADIKAFYGNSPHTMYALVMEDDGELAGIAGIAVEKTRMVALSEMRRKLPAKAIWRGVLAFRKLLNNFDGPILAMRGKEYCNSDKFLERVGFVHLRDITEGEIYLWDRRYYQ